ncbi:MAG: HEAT repeat domain-containing protein, partial [Anaerolineae bacterium]|nr:HEAT repeat domain-containing protein [Anaerolineae bacterium]
APQTRHPRLQPQPERLSPPLLDLLALDRGGFRRRFRGSPILRPRWEGFLRNVCVAAGNWGDPAAAPALAHHLHTAPPLVAVHAAWALGRLARGTGRPGLQAAWERRPEPDVRAAIAAALAG